MDPATADHVTHLLRRLSMAAEAPVAAGFFECPSCHVVHSLAVAQGPAAAPAAAPVAPAAVPVAPAAVPVAAAAPIPVAAAAPIPAAAAAVHAAVAAAAEAQPPAPAPEHPPAGSNPNSPWYAVAVGREVGLFQNWRRVVAPLVLGVPHWDSQRFSTYAQARRHYNDLLAAGLVHVHRE